MASLLATQLPLRDHRPTAAACQALVWSVSSDDVARHAECEMRRTVSQLCTTHPFCRWCYCLGEICAATVGAGHGASRVSARAATRGLPRRPSLLHARARA